MSAVETAPSRAARARARALERLRRRGEHDEGADDRHERRWPWWLALAVVLAVAFGLRVWGVAQGLPYAYNADENAHFVPGAIGLFGHGYNPHYFVNPPAYTYLVHALYALRWGTDPATVGGAYAADPTTAFAIARAASGTLGAAASSPTRRSANFVPAR